MKITGWSDLTVFLNCHNKNKEIKSPIILEYSLDKNTASKIKTLKHFTRWKYTLLMNIHPISFLFQMALCQAGNNSRAWRRGAGICPVFNKRERKKKKKAEKGPSFSKHFSENYHSVWDQFCPGAKDRINRQYTKAEKVRLLWELHPWLHLKLNFKVQMTIIMVVHICSPSGS